MKIGLKTTVACIYSLISRFQAKGHDVTLMICGDFNSTPRSGVNVLLSTGSVPNNHVDWCAGRRPLCFEGKGDALCVLY